MKFFFGKWEIFHSRFQVALGDQFIPTRYASLIIASTPIPFIETVRSLSFFSKFIFIAWFTYLIFYQRKHHENKNENYYYYLLLLSPSILMYTSVGLKEAYIFVFFHLCMFSVLYRKLFLFLISIGILSLLRYEMIFLIGVFSIFYIFIFYYYPEEKVSKKIQNLLKGLIILSILFFLIIFINDLFFLKEYLNLFIETINKMKLGYHMEGDLISELRLYSYDSNFSIIPMIYDGLNAILSPTFSKSPNIFLYLLVIENFLIISLFILYIFALAKLNLLKSIFYIIIFLIFNLSVGILVINDMAIYRYKITMIIPLLLILREEVLSYKNENIIFDKS